MENGSNFLKAFQIFGEDESNNTAGCQGDTSQAGVDEEDQEDQDGDKKWRLLTYQCLNEDDGLEFQLQKYQRSWSLT